MKKIAALALACSLCFESAMAFTPTKSVDVNLSKMPYAELVKLHDNINMAMWKSNDWQEVTVPQGVWKIGKDIPAGHWQITAYDKAYMIEVGYGDIVNGDHISMLSKNYISKTLKGTKNPYGYDKNIDISTFDLECANGYYIVINGASVVFSPYSGKPSFTFK